LSFSERKLKTIRARPQTKRFACLSVYKKRSALSAFKALHSRDYNGTLSFIPSIQNPS
jgi:hypothetical protein